jgi:Flp pilus assembly pilin Flp
MDRMITGIRALLCHFKSRKGQTVVEYALILAFISVLCIIFLSALGLQIQNLYLPIIAALDTARQSIE